MVQKPSGGGQPCPESLVETFGCPVDGPVDCILSDWQAWTACDQTCGFGQRFRRRELKAPAVRGGNCNAASLTDTQGCEEMACIQAEPEECRTSEWTKWSACSVTCGKGFTQRMRSITTTARFGGQGCWGALEEVQSCQQPECDSAECTWGTWKEWSSCSLTCGGGNRQRSRTIISAPRAGFQCQALDKAEVEGCSLQPCRMGCVDGQWGQWREWNQCSTSCSSAFRSRGRDIEVTPSSCGRPAEGLREEFVRCEFMPECTEKQDCKLSQWGPWSHCTASCGGLRERNRYVVASPSGSGLHCRDDVLREVAPCSPGPQGCSVALLADCIMGMWRDWSKCSATCGGGQMARQRTVATFASGGGDPCKGALIVVSPCNTFACEGDGCQDCKWEQWSEWSACTRCGDQKYRTRGVAAMPNACGKPCEPRSAKEVADCAGGCHGMLFCTWTDWSSKQCSECGLHTEARTRALALRRDRPEKYLFLAPEEVRCAGSQLNHSSCPYNNACRPCSPVHCQFGAWADWSELKCQGICERRREIDHVNNECGQPCIGPTISTQRCSTFCDSQVDCLFSEWTVWSGCSMGGTDGQLSSRSRHVVRAPSYGGLPCVGVLRETLGCKSSAPVPCEFEAWADWGVCSTEMCSSGYHARTRQISTYAQIGGRLCNGRMKELQPCHAWHDSCASGQTTTCELSPWGGWTDCGFNGMRYRSRDIERFATNGGEGCAGTLHQTESCGDQAVDCRMSQWTQWDSCDVSCGPGQMHRQRQVERFPANGGTTCPHVLMETKGCSLAQCVSHDVQLSEWSDWCECSATCGPGMQSRFRHVGTPREPGGKPVADVLGEARACEGKGKCPLLDCQWGNWAPWGLCTHSCGGGTRLRKRNIKVFPTAGGNQCDPKDIQEMEHCNTRNCTACEDGQWGPWTPWSPCSASCDGGTTFRTRNVAIMATSCGQPALGLNRMTAFCNVAAPCETTVDCQFGNWSDWSGCSASCGGVQQRARDVVQFGSGAGKWCRGSLKDVRACNPEKGEPQPEVCMTGGPKRNCTLSDWSLWGTCSVTCGGGQHKRSRQILQHPTSGGEGCRNASLQQLGECGNGRCSGPPPTDCVLGDWQQWSPCDSCNGERTRLRQVAVYPENGGASCEMAALVEVARCDRRCGSETFCSWKDWGPWTDCTQTCGTGGKKRRRRYLQLIEGAHKPAAPPGQLYVRAKALQHTDDHEMVAAFLAGCAALMAILASGRLMAAARNWKWRTPSYHRAPAAPPLGETEVAQLYPQSRCGLDIE